MVKKKSERSRVKGEKKKDAEGSAHVPMIPLVSVMMRKAKLRCGGKIKVW